MSPQQMAVNPALAGRIQGFGNVNPPPLPEENAKTIAKRAVDNVGSWVGEELVLTVQDFKEKGAVGALKDATIDAGDMLIDGVASVFGWIRGDPPQEEEIDEKHADDAQKVLENAPRGAAYGLTQASPTGGINAVWVMPDEADPTVLAQLAAEKASAPPGGIQPYAGSSSARAPPPYMPQQNPMMVPGGPMIAPYDPNAGRGKAAGMPPFVPGMQPGFPGAAGFHGMQPGFPGMQPGFPGAQGFPGMQPGFPGAAASSGAGVGVGRIKSMVEQTAQGGSIVGPELVKRLLSTCASSQVSAEQLAEAVAERARRIYLGLDGGSSSSDSDGALARLLALTDGMAQQDTPLAKNAAKLVAQKVPEELNSLQSSAQHQAAAQPMLRRLGLISAPAAQTVDLLGEAPAASASSSSSAAKDMDLLGVGQPASSSSNDLLF